MLFSLHIIVCVVSSDLVHMFVVVYAVVAHSYLYIYIYVLVLYLFCSHVFSLSPFLCPCYCVFLVLMCLCVATCSNVVSSQKLFAISFDLIIGHRFISMAEPRFTLFLVVQKCRWHAFGSIGIFPISIVNPRGLILVSRASVRSCDARAVL